MTAPADYCLAVCNTCQSIQTFTSQRQRDLWMQHHPHDQGQSENFSDD